MSDFQICPRRGGKTTVVRALKRAYEEQRMADFGEVTIDIEEMIEEMAEEALYRLDRMVKEGNAKQKRRMAGWEFLQKAAILHEALADNLQDRS